MIRALRPLLLVVPLAACGHPAAEPPRRPDAARAHFSLDVIDPRVPSRDHLRGQFVVTNTGKVPLWLNARMLLGAGRSSTPFNEVWVETRGPGPIGWWCFFKTPPVEPRHYRLLRPGESAGRNPGGPSEDLRCLGLDQPGTYTLVAHYRDGNEPDEVPLAPEGSVYLTGELVADPVTVEITEGSARQSGE